MWIKENSSQSKLFFDCWLTNKNNNYRTATKASSMAEGSGSLDYQNNSQQFKEEFYHFDLVISGIRAAISVAGIVLNGFLIFMIAKHRLVRNTENRKNWHLLTHSLARNFSPQIASNQLRHSVGLLCIIWPDLWNTYISACHPAHNAPDDLDVVLLLDAILWHNCFFAFTLLFVCDQRGSPDCRCAPDFVCSNWRIAIKFWRIV